MIFTSLYQFSLMHSFSTADLLASWHDLACCLPQNSLSKSRQPQQLHSYVLTCPVYTVGGPEPQDILLDPEYSRHTQHNSKKCCKLTVLGLVNRVTQYHASDGFNLTGNLELLCPATCLSQCTYQNIFSRSS